MKTLRAVAIVGAMAIAGGVIAAGDPGSANADTVGAELLAPTSILTATAGLIAFHIGLYTLVGRERKSPYIINSVFLVFSVLSCDRCNRIIIYPGARLATRIYPIHERRSSLRCVSVFRLQGISDRRPVDLLC
jgi:hypothetical protein